MITICDIKMKSQRSSTTIYNEFTQALSKKEKGGGLGSPGGDDSDGEADYTLTPRTEAKYNKIDEEFHLMMQKSQLNGARVSFPP